jgi:hypothetical protein
MSEADVMEEVEKKLTSRIPEDVYDCLARLAKEDRRSLNAELVVLLEEAVAARVAKKAAAAREVEEPIRVTGGAQQPWAAAQPQPDRPNRTVRQS